MNKPFFISLFAVGLTAPAFAAEDNAEFLSQCGNVNNAPQQYEYQIPPRFTPPPMPAWVKQRMAQRPMRRIQAPRFRQWRGIPIQPRMNPVRYRPIPAMRYIPARPVYYYNRPRYAINNGYGRGNTNMNSNGYGQGYGNGYGNGRGNGETNGSGDMDGHFNFGFSGKARGNGRSNVNANTQQYYQGNGAYQGQGNYQGDGAYQGQYNQNNGYNQPVQLNIEPAPIVETPVVETVILADTDNDGVADNSDFCTNTPANSIVDAFGCDKAASIVLRGVHFKTNSDELTPDSIRILDVVVDTLIRNPGLPLEIAGHTDSDGDAAYNKNLSQRRATQVLVYLANHHVDTSTMKATGYGEEQPIASNETAEGKAQNRRVELNRL